MPRVAKALTPLEVRRITTPGLHAVGEVAGLNLYVKPDSGARSWVLRTTVNGVRRHLGLGGFPSVTLAQARERAREELDQIRKGRDVVAERQAQRAQLPWTFEKVAGLYIEAHKPGWRSEKHAAQWTSTLKTYAHPRIGSMHVADITRADIVAILDPIWTTKNETAGRVRNRIELILGFAVQRGWRPEGPNPARWKENLDKAFLRADKVRKKAHFAALPLDDLHGFMQRLQKVEGMGALALRFTILTAARSGEVRNATWDEIDLERATWTIPAHKMKAERPHRVPLSAPAIELLRSLPRFEVEPDKPDLVFPGAKRGAPLSDMSLTAALRRMKVNATAHGFRSTFRDFCSERTSVSSEVAEMSLAHAIGDQTEAAYRRGDLFEKRRELMETWARFCDTPPQPSNVTRLSDRSAA